MTAHQVTVCESGDGRYSETITIGRHTLRSDEPTASGGDDNGPSPYQLILAALGACTAMTIRMYADRHKMPLSRTTVELQHFTLPSIGDAGKLDYFTRTIRLEGELTDEQKLRLLEISEKCPVGETLRRSATVDARLAGMSDMDPAA
ncbi:OsmC family protein [Bradyrhizobium sp. Arg68]|uniref:OsmC family protein n=1 Tax=Bradyrhizobium ivorense TaxID=2511166 RepID=UPI001E35E65D|nr:OsmC family protein [Bradyrhizobium ivorense]MCC8935678.1 OsmC family protein [Bradyrhizobium ivorense]